MNENHESGTPLTDSAAPPDAGDAAKALKKARSPYLAFFWGGLIMSALCFWLGTERLEIKRPARADAYFITGILGILSAAMAWSLGAAHERARRSQQSLQDAVDRLQDRMQDMPRSLMEESVRVAEREAEGRRADQERQARELRTALEAGIRTGFEPLAPALSDRIAGSLAGLSEALRQDREERAAALRATAETVASMQTAQAEWARASSALLEKLRTQGEALQAGLSERDADSRAAWEQLANSARATWDELAATSRTTWENMAASARAAWAEGSAATTQGVQAALDGQMEKVHALTESLSAQWAETLKAQRESFAGDWRDVLEQSRARLEADAAALREAVTGATATVEAVSSEAEARLGATSAQAEEWLRNLSTSATTMGEALEAMRRGGEEAAAQQAAGQAEWRATVEMFHQGMGGLLDRLQALGSYTQAQAALLERMEEVIRSFEERSADLIEETAMKAQESLLDALDQAGARDAAGAQG